MVMIQSIYEINPSVEERRPFLIGTTVRADSQEHILQIKILHGELPASGWKGLDFRCEDCADATKWDYFMYSLTSGVFSKRAIQALEPYLHHFTPLPVTLDGAPYFVLRFEKRQDVLDILNSEIVFFEGDWIDKETPDDDDIHSIDRYVFHNLDRIQPPAIFAIPQTRDFIYCTNGVPEAVKTAKLRGFQFVPIYEQ